MESQQLVISGIDDEIDSEDKIRFCLEEIYFETLGFPIQPFQREVPFIALGGDSFKAVKLYQRCQEKYLNVSLPLILSSCLEDVAQFVASQLSEVDQTDGTSSEESTAWAFPLLPENYDFSKIEELLAENCLALEDIESIYPCSHIQHNIYLGKQTSPDTETTVYQTSGLFTIPRWCNAKLLRFVWHGIVRRHQALRTVYVDAPDIDSDRLLDAVVLRNVPEYLNLSIVDEDCSETSLDKIRETYTTCGNKDLANYSHRVTVYSNVASTEQMAQCETLCKIEIPHMVVDGSSLCILLDELNQGLRLARSGSDVDIHNILPSPTQYQSYIEYLQRDEAHSENASLDYWVGYLDGATPCHFPRLSEESATTLKSGSSSSKSVPISIPFAQVQEFCRKSNVTLSNLFQAAWAVLLQTYTGEKEVCYGYLSSGRSIPVPGVSTIVGPMMNLLVNRVSALDAHSIGGVIDQVRNDMLDALQYQTLPLQKVQSILGMSQTPLFDTIVTSYYAPAMLRQNYDDNHAENAPVRLLEWHNASNFQLVLKIVYSETDIRVRLAYSPTKLSTVSAAKVAQTFESILHKMMVDDIWNTQLVAMDTISKEDWQQIKDWNQTTLSELPSGDLNLPEACIHWLFQEKSELQPFAPAISSWDGAMDYQTLDMASSTVARKICALGIGPGAFVPLRFEKSKWYIVALLAILKSGNAFVPLDLSNPAARVSKMLTRLGISKQTGLLLCSSSQYAECAVLACHVLAVSEASTERKPRSHILQQSLLPRGNPRDAVYVIFTSGSTGEPKGVVVEHAAYAYASRVHKARLQLDETSRVLQFASYGFDTSMEDHLTTLVTGGCICVPSEGIRTSLGELAEFATLHRANWVHITPSLAQTFRPRDLPTIKTMVLGGEPMTCSNIETWSRSTRLIQVYGPAECCVTSTVRQTVLPGSCETDIGVALAGCATWITRVDNPSMLCSIGAVGELLVEGPILARGYLGEPELTSAAFVRQLPWAAEKICYRTGDLARYVIGADGQLTLHFVGRKDSQVKINGQRLELGEIERVLCLQSHIRHAQVLAPKSGPCQNRLVALLSPESSQREHHIACNHHVSKESLDLVDGSWEAQIRSFKDFLHDRLPSYMIPEVFILVNTFPRNSSGKLDRKWSLQFVEGLSDQDHQQLASRMMSNEMAPARPGSKMELIMRAIWSKVLRFPEEQIQWDTSFFYLGGDSISAMMISHAARQKGMTVTAGDILHYRRIDRLVQAIPEVAAAVHSDFQPEEEVQDTGEPFPLSPIQRLHFAAHGCHGDALEQQNLVLQLNYQNGIPVPDNDVLRRALHQLLVIHPMLRARFFQTENHDDRIGQIHQKIAMIDDASNMRIRFHSEVDRDYVLECIKDARRSIHLSQGPLIAVDFFRGIDQHLLSFTIHHLVVDTVSWRIVLNHLQGLLLSQGRAQAESETSSYRWWCCLSSNQARPSKEPVDNKMPSSFDTWSLRGKTNTFGQSKTRSFHLGPTTTAAIGRITKEATDFDMVDVLSAALLKSFADTFDRMPELFLESHGRDSGVSDMGQLGNVVGWFTAFAPLRLSSGPSTGRTFLDNSFQLLLNLVRKARSKPPPSVTDFNSSMEVTLNYLGAFQQVESNGMSSASPFGLYNDKKIDAGLAAMKLEQRTHSERYSLISVLVKHADNCLGVEITWNKEMSQQQDLIRWVRSFEETLVDIPQQLLGTDQPLISMVHVDHKRLAQVLGVAQRKLKLQPGNIESMYPCAPIQDSLMLAQLKDDESTKTGAYEQHFLFEVASSCRGPVDAERLRSAWHTVVQRHAIMRTIFIEDDSGFLQVVLKHATPTVDVCYQADLASADSLESLWRQQIQEGSPHPLEGALLHKLRIFIDPQPHAPSHSRVFCGLSKNHLISGGQTSRLLIKELLDTYDGREVPERVPYSQYIDFVYKQNTDETERWWFQYLSGTESCHFPRFVPPKVKGDHHEAAFAQVKATIDNKEAFMIRCQKDELTTPAILCTAWSLTLKAYLDTENVLFGLMFWGRDLPLHGAESILGPMINLLPIRARVLDDSTAIRVCHDFQANYVQQLARQTLSLARIQTVMNAARGGQGPSRAMFNTMVNIQKKVKENAGKTSAKLLFSHDTTEYDIALSIIEEADGFAISLEHRTDLISAAQAERVLKVFVGAVNSIVMSPDRLVGSISMASPLDMAQIDTWNSATLSTNYRCIHEMILQTTLGQDQAAQPAISSWDRSLTYGELDNLSSCLARRLVSLGTQPNHVVVLCFEKSMWAVVSMLAVAKAGAAFIHVHPSHPYERVKAIMEQTGSRLSLASRSQYARLSELMADNGIVLAVEEELLHDKIEAGSFSSSQVQPSHVMYMISTSGTTGKPKLVVTQHQSFSSAVQANRSRLQMDASSRVLQFTDYCFDACLEEIFTVLVAGGCICIPSDHDRLSDIAGFIKRHNVTWAAFTPSFLRTLQPVDIVPPVRFITVHAEPISQALVDHWADRVHMRPSYGPTECSVTSTVGAALRPGADARNIGWPTGCHGWVVHPRNHNLLMPVGAVGELLIEGPILGQCYFGDEDKTNASFISPPSWAPKFPQIQQSRFYKTGDLVRYDLAADDGSLLILHRMDDSQVKVRGQRVELREIEHHLDCTGAVQHGMVLMPRKGILQDRVVAVINVAATPVVAQNRRGSNSLQLISRTDLNERSIVEHSQALQTIRGSLANRVPGYMMPEIWLVVEKLPVQISHKIDRIQVTKWVETIDQDMVDTAYDLTKTQDGATDDALSEEEIAIREAWGHALRLDPESISLDQSFFQLGGHSLSAIEMKRACVARGFHLSAQDVLSNPSIRKLAAIVKRTPSAPQPAAPTPTTLGEVEIESNNRVRAVLLKYPQLASCDKIETAMLCSPLQRRMYLAFHHKREAPYLFNNLVELLGQSNISSPQAHIDKMLQAWQQIVNRHAILRTVFVGDTSKPDAEVIQVVLKTWIPSIDVLTVDSSVDAIKKSQAHVDEFRQTAFKDYSPPASLRILVESNTGRLYVHVILGHMLIDHVSLAHVMADFDTCVASGQAAALLPPVQRHFRSYLENMPRGRVAERESTKFWASALRNMQRCIVPPNLPQHPSASTSLHSVGSICFNLDLTPAITTLCTEARVTLSNLLQFAWALLLRSDTGNDAVCFAHLVSDRDLMMGGDEDEIVGPLLCLGIACVTFSGGDTVFDTMRCLQNHNIASMSHMAALDLTAVERELCSRPDQTSQHRHGSQRNLSATMFNTMVNYRKVQYRSSHSPKAKYRSLWKQDPHEQDIVLSVNEHSPEQLAVELSYYNHMFTNEMAKSLTKRYCHILSVLSSAEYSTMGELMVLLDENGLYDERRCT